MKKEDFQTRHGYCCMDFNLLSSQAQAHSVTCSGWIFYSWPFYCKPEMPNLKRLKGTKEFLPFLLLSHEYAIIISFLFTIQLYFNMIKKPFLNMKMLLIISFFIYEIVNSPSQVFILILQKSDWQVYPPQKLSLLEPSCMIQNMLPFLMVMLIQAQNAQSCYVWEVIQVTCLSTEGLQGHYYFL